MRLYSLLWVFFFSSFIIGCSGVKTFPNRVAPGETVAVAAGWKHYFAKNNITVTVTPQGGTAIPITAEHIRASFNLYPDPLSSVVLSTETGGDISPHSLAFSDVINLGFTGGDEDWWQSVVFLDLPDAGSLLPGLADITISNPEGESVKTTVRVIDPDSSVGGSADLFDTDFAGPLNPDQLASLERVDHYVVSFAGSTVPYAVQLDLDYSNITGYVVNPRGFTKNISWSDNSEVGVYKVIILPANGQQNFKVMDDLKFYVAVTAGAQSTASLDVVPGSVLAFDGSGNQIQDPVLANVTLVRGVAGLN